MACISQHPTLRTVGSALETNVHAIACCRRERRLLGHTRGCYGANATNHFGCPNSKTREGSKHIDRNAKFRYNNEQAVDALDADQLVISVDTKGCKAGALRAEDHASEAPKGESEIDAAHHRHGDGQQTIPRSAPR